MLCKHIGIGSTPICSTMIEWKDIPKYHIIEVMADNERFDVSYFLVKLSDNKYREIEAYNEGEKIVRDLDDMWVQSWEGLSAHYTIVADHGYLDEMIFQFVDRLAND